MNEGLTLYTEPLHKVPFDQSPPPGAATGAAHLPLGSTEQSGEGTRLGPGREAMPLCGTNPRGDATLYNSRNAAAIGRRAARRAGRRPPIRPINVAQTIPFSRSCGVTAKLKATWLKLCQFMVEAWKLLKAA
jgi:hypothetical protein